MRRRLLLASVAATAVAAAVGLLRPARVLAANWPSPAFSSDALEEALHALYGTRQTLNTEKVTLEVPERAADGRFVQVTVSSTLPQVEAISIFSAGNAHPLTSVFLFGKEARPQITTRIKMAKGSRVIAVVKSGGQLYSASKKVQIAAGGCGG